MGEIICLTRQAWHRKLASAVFSPRGPTLLYYYLPLLHFLGLSAVILLTQPTLGLDVFEQVAWARDPQWAYAKHPPLPAWIMAAAIWLAGNKPWIAAVLGAATSAAALLVVWALARRLVSASLALIAVFLLEGVIYFNVAAADFNHNVILLPLWAFVAYAAHRAFVEGKAMDWTLLGIAAGLGMLGKYATAFLLLAVLAAFLADRQGRAKLWSKGPWIAGVCGTAILAPHIWALYRIDFAPFYYAEERLKSATSIFDHLLFPLGWLGAQLLNSSLALCLAGIVLFSARSKLLRLENADDGIRRNLQFFGILFAAPLLTGLAIQAVGGVRFHDMWGFPMFVLLGIVVALLIAASPLQGRELAPKFAAGGMAFLGLTAIALFAMNLASPYAMHKGARHQFPAQELAKQLGSRWEAQFPSTPVRYVASDVWLGGMLTAYHPNRPSVLISGNFANSPWIAPERIQRNGAIVIWQGDYDGERLMKQFPDAILQSPLELAYQTGAKVPAARVNWAILPPCERPRRRKPPRGWHKRPIARR